MKHETASSILVTSLRTPKPERHVNLPIFATVLGAVLILSACDSDSSSDSTPDALHAPLNVQVVAGDGYSSEMENTVSWAEVPDATSYKVYWDMIPGVTDDSSEVVPTAQGVRYASHSGADVVAGSGYYYRVQALAAERVSDLSAEVTATPQQSITRMQLNDIAWNGSDTLIAVGDSGVILNSPTSIADGWSEVSAAGTPQSLTGVTWDDVNAQFMIVGAGSTVLSGDGTNWKSEDLRNLPGAVNLEDVTWLGDRYIAVGKRGAIVTSNSDGSVWAIQDAGANVATTALNAVASNSDRIVVVGTKGTILNSIDGIEWKTLPKFINNDLNDICWDGRQFVVAGSNDTILTSPDGVSWNSHIPGTSDINFVAVTQWDSSLPDNPVLAAVGSAGTFVVSPDSDPGIIIRTGTTEQLGGITWVDDGMAPAYFVMVGNNGTVLSNQYQ